MRDLPSLRPSLPPFDQQESVRKLPRFGAGSARPLEAVLKLSAPILDARRSPEPVRSPRLGIGLSVTDWLTEARLNADAAAPRRLSGPRALVRKLVQELGDLLARDHL
jgi:hypothetical protein